jgi:hypothetical protein
LHWGYAETFQEYAEWLWRADILPVTSRQDFFGGSVVEAMYCHTYPLLPNRLAFPEHISEASHEEHLYDTDDELFNKVSELLMNGLPKQNTDFRQWVQGYDWNESGSIYDDCLVKNIK